MSARTRQHGEAQAPEAGRAPARRRTAVAVATAGAVLVALALAGVLLYARGGGPLPEWAGFLRPGANAVLEPSGPAETVLRTLRLAGFEHAAVGDSAGTVVVRVEAPSVATPADVELSWQTALAAASSAYPAARTIVAQVFSRSQALVEVSAPAAAVRAAVKADDAAALRKASAVRYLPESGDE